MYHEFYPFWLTTTTVLSLAGGMTRLCFWRGLECSGGVSERVDEMDCYMAWGRPYEGRTAGFRSIYLGIAKEVGTLGVCAICV